MNTPKPPDGWEDDLFDEDEAAEHENYHGLLPERKGEIVVRASVNGRELTLDPIREKVLDAPWREVESLLPCGMQLPWIDGDYDGEPFQLTSGASAGSRWMTFAYKGHFYCMSATDMIEKLIGFADEIEGAK